ncbi:MAG TPA: hypothetical protein VGH57_22725 [Amycolatopsis sp.]
MEISDLAGRIRDHRFDGWTDTAIATEIERFGTGDGIGSIGTAVDALKAVASALADTDNTLRTQLTQLGVEWQSEAGGQAGQVFTQQAGFSQDAMTKVSHTAEMLFAQGEAFNRTKYKLPDADTVLKGAGGYTVGDSLASLIGFETDHASQVDAAQNARSQALEALNDYAQQSGENLLSTETLNAPQTLTVAPPGGQKSVTDLAGSVIDVTPDGSVKPASASVQSHYVQPPVVQPVSNAHVDPPTPAYGIAVQAPPVPPGAGSGSGNGTTTSSAPSGGQAAVPPPSGWVEAPGRGTAQEPSGGQRSSGGFVPPVSGGSGIPGPGSGPGLGSGSGAGPGSGSGSAGRPPMSGSAAPGSGTMADGVFGRGTTGGTGGGDQTLGRGRFVGSAPEATVAPSQSGSPAAAPRGGMSAGELGAGAAALGAGAAGGALSGEQERQGRGFGAGSGKNPVRPLPVDDLPEEEAIALRKAEQISPEPPRDDTKFLAPAATQGEGEEDEEHVRRFGVDDKDLFNDRRMVSRDVIGDDAGDGRRP